MFIFNIILQKSVIAKLVDDCTISFENMHVPKNVNGGFIN